MPLTGKIKNLFEDKDMTISVFPRTKVKAVSDDNGVGLDAILNAITTKLTPRNLLDNSDFTNPVNQRGQTSYNNGYTIDRWTSSNANLNVIVGDGKITLSKSKSGGTFCQYLPFDVTGKRLTLAINTSIGLLLHSFVSDGDDLPKIEGLSAYFGVKVSNGITQVLFYFNNSDTIEFDLYWAALYEGEYTLETLPKYQPKGYMVEALNCGALTVHKTLTIPASGWSSTAPYTQTVSVEGVNAEDVPHVSPVYSDDLTSALAQKEAWGMVSRAKTVANAITFYCFEDKPSADIPVQIEVNR